MMRVVTAAGALCCAAFLLAIALHLSGNADAQYATRLDQLRSDQDFRRAVESIVENCRVDDDRIRC